MTHAALSIPGYISNKLVDHFFDASPSLVKIHFLKKNIIFQAEGEAGKEGERDTLILLYKNKVYKNMSLKLLKI